MRRLFGARRVPTLAERLLSSPTLLAEQIARRVGICIVELQTGDVAVLVDQSPGAIGTIPETCWRMAEPFVFAN